MTEDKTPRRTVNDVERLDNLAKFFVDDVLAMTDDGLQTELDNDESKRVFVGGLLIRRGMW